MVYIRLTTTQIEELVQHLDAACQELFESGEDCLTIEQLEEIKQQIFECTTCGWWFEVSEMSEENEQLCTECV